MTVTPPTCRLLAATTLALLPFAAQASCGSAFCPLNTQWEVQGVWSEPGLRLDLRQEFIDQDQLRQGSDTIAIGQVPQHHDEVRTLNRNTLLTLDYSFSPQWGLALTLPWINRDHRHIHNHMGVPEPESWAIDELGDARLLGRYRAADSHLSLLGGLKLPTGDFEVANADGETAERSLQPGSGSTDLLVGAAWQQGSRRSPWSWFLQGLLQQPLDSRADYRPGYHLGVDGGLRYALAPRVSLMAQLNFLAKGHDHGLEAEPEDSGGRYLFASPGISLALGDRTQVYAFLQQPLYQHVNGIQLTADQAYSAGISFRF